MTATIHSIDAGYQRRRQLIHDVADAEEALARIREEAAKVRATALNGSELELRLHVSILLARIEHAAIEAEAREAARWASVVPNPAEAGA